MLQVLKAVVETVQVDWDIFVEHNNMFYVSAAKLDRILSMAIFPNLNSLNSGGSSGHGKYKENITFHCGMFGDIMVFKAESGWEYSTRPKEFDLDLAPCLHLPLAVLRNHPTIPEALLRINSLSGHKGRKTCSSCAENLAEIQQHEETFI